MSRSLSTTSKWTRTLYGAVYGLVGGAVLGSAISLLSPASEQQGALLESGRC
jgi:hypothetical protein